MNTNFTIELKQDDKLAFLDVLVMQTQDGKLATKVQGGHKVAHQGKTRNLLMFTKTI